MKTPARYAAVTALLLTLGSLPARIVRTPQLAIDRDGQWTRPIKAIQAVVVRILDELGTPHP